MMHLASLVIALLPASALAEVVELATPTEDRWHYPFNFTPGTRAIGSCFGAAGSAGFNDRDGYVVVAWDTREDVCPGLGPEAYDVRAVTVTLTNREGAEWPPDTSVDEWFTYDVNGDGELNADGVERGMPEDTDGESDDADAGRPLELFGAGFGPTHDSSGWTETSLFVGGSGDADAPRDPFPFVFQEETGNVLHVEDSVAGLHNESVVPALCDDPAGVCPFTPVPWAIGEPTGYTSSSAFDVAFSIDLGLSEGAVRRHFQEALDAGRVVIIVTSLREAVQQGSQSGFPAFFMKEAEPLDKAAKAPALRIDVVVEPTGDFDGDAVVALPDWDRLAECAGGPAAIPDPRAGATAEECLCRFDFDGDEDVDLRDAGAFQLRFTGDL